MVGEISVHYDDIVSCRELNTVDVCSAEAQLASAGFEVDVGCIDFRKLVCNNLSAIWRAIVDDDEFPIKVAIVFINLALWGHYARERLTSQ